MRDLHLEESRRFAERMEGRELRREGLAGGGGCL